MNWLAQRFELSRGGDACNVRPMEGLRGFAVLLVFLVHYTTLVRPWIENSKGLLVLTNTLHVMGNAGVDLFFVLSGYLIYGSLISRPQRFSQFMARRIKRIYPAFTVVFVIYVALSLLFPHESKIPRSTVEGAIYLATNYFLLPGLLPIKPMITVAWSLSYEIFYYLMIPLIIGILGLRQRGSGFRIGLFLLVAASVGVGAAFCGGPVRLIMFISGILLYEAITSRRILVPSSALALSMLVLGLAATLLPNTGPIGLALKSGILFVTFFVVCLTCFANPRAWLSRMLSWTPLRWFGNMSYSYYLLHGLVLKAGFMALAMLPVAKGYAAGFFWVSLPLMFALTLIPTSVLFLTVERPFSLVSSRAHPPES